MIPFVYVLVVSLIHLVTYGSSTPMSSEVQSSNATEAPEMLTITAWGLGTVYTFSVEGTELHVRMTVLQGFSKAFDDLWDRLNRKASVVSTTDGFLE